MQRRQLGRWVYNSYRRAAGGWLQGCMYAPGTVTILAIVIVIVIVAWEEKPGGEGGSVFRIGMARGCWVREREPGGGQELTMCGCQMKVVGPRRRRHGGIWGRYYSSCIS